MKKILVSTALSLFMASTCLANTVQTEALESIDAAKQMVEGGRYSKAIDELNYALSKINELTAEELLAFLPEAPQGFTLVDKQSQGGGAAASLAGSAGAHASYSYGDSGTVELRIAIGGVTGKMAGLAALGSIFSGLGQESGMGQARQIRVKGYTGTEMFSPEEKGGTLTFQIGKQTSVTLEGEGLASVEPLNQLARAIDFAGLEKTF